MFSYDYGNNQRIRKIRSALLLISNYIKDNKYLLPDPYSKHVDIDEYSSILNKFGVVFVALNEGEILGLICGYINDYISHNAYVQILIIRQSSQNYGCGSALLRAFICKAIKEDKNGNVFLSVDKSNIHAYEVYKHVGFVESERVHPNPLKQIMKFTF